MPHILAIAPEDGWAYVRSDNKIYLVRPPYTRSTMTPVDEKSIEKAVSTYGFSALERDFGDWKGLIAFLNQEVAAARKSHQEELAESGYGEQFLELASCEDLLVFLDRVEEELLPGRKWDHAENILLSMLQLPKVHQDAQLVERTTALLRRTSEERREAEESKSRLIEEATDAESVSPLADRRYGWDNVAEYAQRILERRQIFAFA